MQSVSFVLGRLAVAAQAAPFADRPGVVAALTAQGITEGVAQWLAQSTRNAPSGGVEFVYDISTMQALLQVCPAAERVCGS